MHVPSFSLVVCANAWSDLQTAFDASAEQWCTASFFGGCMDVASFIRRPKFCGAIETMQYPRDACLIGREPATLVSWIHSACNLTFAAATRWNNSIAEQATIASSLKLANSFDRGPACSSKCSGLTDLYSASSFTEQCSGTNSQRTCPNSYSTGCAMNRTALQRNCRPSSTFVNTTAFCAGLADTSRCSPFDCLVPPGPAKLLSWVDSVCNTTDLHSRWSNSNSQRSQIFSHLISVDSFKAPSCSRSCQSLSDLYNASLFSEPCADKDNKGNCRDSGKFVNTTQYCSGLAGVTDYCPNACTYGNEPRSLFSFLNTTCTLGAPVMMGWRNTTLAKEEKWLAQWIPSLLPWDWAVQSHAHAIEPSSRGIQITDPMASSTPYISVRSSGAGTCPTSTSQKLGVFAAVNVMSACLLPILGRRTFVQKVTFGLGGRMGSRGWYLLGFAAACMQIASNVINAYIIRITPGYEHISFTALALLWCTRPRLSWLAVFLASYQADKGMYLNSAASAITTEAILQSLGAVYFGISANYARKRGFYLVKHLDPYPRGKSAHIMYSGALLWLIVLIFTLGACVSSMVGLNTVISNAREMMTDIERAAGAGATAVRTPVQKWLPKWAQKRIEERQKRLENPVPKKPPRKLTPSEVQEIESVTAAVIIFLAFLAQWLFWAGFVKAAGERYVWSVTFRNRRSLSPALADIVHQSWRHWV